MIADKNKRLLKAARAEQGYNQRALAKKLNVSQATISNWDNNIETASFGDVVKLCRLLKIDINELERNI